MTAGRVQKACLKLDVLAWPGNQIRAEQIAEETAVALVYNGVSHVVMMCSPQDLEDFALGFSLSEGIISEPGEIYAIEPKRQALGIELQIEISQRCFEQLKHRRRNLTGRTGCGLCGAESLQQAIRPLPKLTQTLKPKPEAIDQAVRCLQQTQYLQASTGAVHAAALVQQNGEIILLREDIGRHNALDKLIGAATQQGLELSNLFALVSSRGSYEMVQKSARCGISCLVCVSAATSLAIEQAQSCGQNLIGFTRPGRHTYYTSFKHE